MTDYDAPSGLSGGAILRLTVVQTAQSVGLNQSTDATTLTLYKGTFSSFDLSGTTYSGAINGTAYSGSFTFDFRVTTSKLITSRTDTITHLADGTKTISVSGGIGSTGTSTGGPATAAGSFTQTPLIAPVSGAVVSRLSHTRTQPFEHLAQSTTEAGVLAAIQATAAEITLATLPAGLSTSRIAAPDAGSTLLDAFNQVVRTEQGYLYTATTGTLTSPSQKVVVRERTRPATVSYSFNALTELSDVPPFLRDLTNLASTVTADGPTQSVSYTDATLTGRVGSANITDTVLNTDYIDLLAYAQDRALRGKNINLRVVSVTIDALTTPTDRSADLLAMVPGDRIQITNVPSTTLGFTTWDAWLIGGRETFRSGDGAAQRFELFLQPVLADTAIYDTNLFMSDGVMTLDSAITTSGATTMNVTTSNATTLLETVTFPYTLIIDSEQVTVTACTAGAPQVATITRGVNGTTATTHSAGAAVEVAVSSLYAF